VRIPDVLGRNRGRVARHLLFGDLKKIGKGGWGPIPIPGKRGRSGPLVRGQA